MSSLFTAILCCKRKDKLLETSANKNTKPSGLSPTQSALMAFCFVVLYLLFGMLVFRYVCSDVMETAISDTAPAYPFLNALYFSVVTISTVGYGDISPDNPGGYWFAVFYMIFGIAMVGVALGTVGSFLMARQEELLQKAIETNLKKTGRKRLLSPAQWKLISALGILLLFLTLGTVCFYFLNDMDEDDYEYGVTKAVFLTVQTVTTVGYGAPLITTNAARIFAIPFILFGTLIVAASLGTFADVFIERRQEKIAESILKAEFNLEAILAMDADGNQEIDLAEFLEYMLVNMGKVSQMDITKIKNQFHELDVDGSGVLDRDDIAIMKKKALAEAAEQGNYRTIN